VTNTVDKGTQTEAVVLSVLAKAGYTVLMPFGPTRYDLAIDARDGTGIKTVQCKTGRILKGCIVWSTCSVHTQTYVKTDYRGQADFFAVWCPAYGEDVYLVPVDEVGLREGSLRINPLKRPGELNKECRWADKYKVQSIERDIA
jgi:PD-(D/E)XK endonuclease